MLRLTALLSLISTTALAQVTLSFPGNTDAVSFAPGSCASRVPLTWSVLAQQQPCDNLELFVTTGVCGDEPAATDYDLGSETITGTTNPTGTKTIEFAKLPGLASSEDAGFVCGSAGEKTWKVCGVYQGNNSVSIGFCSTKIAVKANSLTIKYDGAAPNAPNVTVAEGVERAIQLTATVTDDANTVRFGVRLLGSTEAFTFTTEVAVDTTNVEGRVTGLENGVEYEVVAVAVDDAGNVSGESNMLTAIPTETLGFWDAYKKAGGTEEGGCASAPGLAVSCAVGFALWISRRKKS